MCPVEQQSLPAASSPPGRPLQVSTVQRPASSITKHIRWLVYQLRGFKHVPLSQLTDFIVKSFGLKPNWSSRFLSTFSVCFSGQKPRITVAQRRRWSMWSKRSPGVGRKRWRRHLSVGVQPVNTGAAGTSGLTKTILAWGCNELLINTTAVIASLLFPDL